MARLLTCGFGENALTTTMWTGTTGNAPTIGSTAPHSGTYRMNTSALAGNSYVRRDLSAQKTTGTLFTRFYFQADDATPTLDSRILAWVSSVPADCCYLELLTTGALKLTNAVAATTATSSATLSNATWYRIEHKVILSDTVGDNTVLLYNDSGTLLETITVGAGNEDTLPATANYLTARFGKTASVSIFSYDDIAINDAVDPGDGSQMTYPGIGKTYMLVPNSDVAITWEDDAGGTDNATFANIDGLPVAVDDTDYNASDTTLDVLDALGQDDRFGLTNLGAEVTADATIRLADVYGRVGSSQTFATHLNFLIWDESSTLTTGPTCTCNVNGWRIVSTAEHLVINTAGKTKANLDSFNVGYEPITDVLAARPRRVSELWVNVEWTEASASAAQIVPAIQDSCEMIGMRLV